VNKFPSPHLRHKIYAFGGSAREDDLIRACGADIARDRFPWAFVSLRRARAQLVKTAMHVCIFVFVIMPKRIENGPWLLRSGRAVKVNQGMPVRLLAEDCEILTNRIPIYSATGDLVHSVICSTRGSAPLYSGISSCRKMARISTLNVRVQQQARRSNMKRLSLLVTSIFRLDPRCRRLAERLRSRKDTALQVLPRDSPALVTAVW